VLTISERINQLILAAIHYRNREILVRWVTSEHNRNKFNESARQLETQKKVTLECNQE